MAQATPDKTKLPKWAQEQFRTLEMRLRESEKARANAEARLDVYLLRDKGDVEGRADTYIKRYGDKGDIPIGMGETITFVIERHAEDADPRSAGRAKRWIDVRLKTSGLLNVSSDRTLLVRPRATNSAELESEKY